MGFAKIKFLTFVLFSIFLQRGTISTSIELNLSFNANFEISINDIIVIEDDVLRVETNNPFQLIELIEVFSTSGIKLLETNCHNSSNCQVDLSELPDGDYDVYITTSDGNSFSNQITIN